MKKFLFGALITLFLAACAGLAPTAWSPEEAQAMATVHELMSPSPAGLCSAVTISPNHAMSAAHCYPVANTKGYLVVKGKQLPVKEVKITGKGDDDQMIMYVPGLECPCAPIATEKAIPGEGIIAIGFPYGISKTLTIGTVQNRAKIYVPPEAYLYGEIPPDEVFLVTSVPVLPGNSGGGMFVYRNNRYELVAIVSRGGGSITLGSELK